MITDTWRASFCEELADISKLVAITRTLIIIEGDLSTDSVNYFIEAQKKFKSAAQNLRTTVLNDKKST